jgi:hypothetical protein
MKTTYVGIMDIDVKTSFLKHGSKVYNIEKKIPGNRHELEVTLEDKVYLEMYYRHQPWSVVVDEILAKIKAHGLQIVGWTLTKDQQFMKLNLGTDAKPQMVNINAQLGIGKVLEVEKLKNSKMFMHGHTKI